MVILPNDLVNVSTQTSNGFIKNKLYRKEDFLSRQTRFFRIVALLCKNNAYDEETLQIRKPDGSLNSNSNVVKLIQLALAKVKINSGLEDFIYQLKAAKVNPDLIVNELIKSKVQSVLPAEKNSIATQTEEYDWPGKKQNNEETAEPDIDMNLPVQTQNNSQDTSGETDWPAFDDDTSFQTVPKTIDTVSEPLRTLSDQDIESQYKTASRQLPADDSDLEWDDDGTQLQQWDIPTTSTAVTETLPKVMIERGVGPDVGTRYTRIAKRLRPHMSEPKQRKKITDQTLEIPKSKRTAGRETTEFHKYHKIPDEAQDWNSPE